METGCSRKHWEERRANQESSWKRCGRGRGHRGWWANCLTYLGKGSGARGHQNLTHTVVEALHWLIIHTQETLGCPLLSNLNHKVKVNLSLALPQEQRPTLTTTVPPTRLSWLIMNSCARDLHPHLPQRYNATSSPLPRLYLILQVPDPILVGEFLIAGAAFRQDAALKATHVEKQVGVVLTIHRHEAVLPLNCSHWSWQTVLDVPEHCPTPAHKEHMVISVSWKELPSKGQTDPERVYSSQPGHSLIHSL